MIIHPQKQIRAGRSRAFTLVELLMVMAIMLVIMGFVIVAFPSYRQGGQPYERHAKFRGRVEPGAPARAGSEPRGGSAVLLPAGAHGWDHRHGLPGDALHRVRCIGEHQHEHQLGDGLRRRGESAATCSGCPPASSFIPRAPSPGVRAPTSPRCFPRWTMPPPPPPPRRRLAQHRPPPSLKATYGTEYFPGNGNVVAVAYAAFQFKPNASTTLDPLGTLGSSASTSDKWFMSFVLEIRCQDGCLEQRPSRP